MKKFVVEFIIITILSILGVVGINYIYLHCNRSESEIDKFAEMPETIEVCNVGSSHGKNSFLYDDYIDEINCFNFGLTSQRYQYDYRLVKAYADRMDEGAIVFIPFSYFSLWGTPDEERDDFKSMNNRYYKILPPELIMEYDPWVDVCEHYLPVLSAYDELIDAIKDTLFGDGNNSTYNNEQIDFDKAVEDAYKAQVLEYRNADGTRVLNNDRVEALEDLIELCKKSNLKPILITTPVLKEFHDVINERNPEFLEEFYEAVYEISERTDTEYWDYSMDSRISGNKEYFIDAHHLNKDGAKLFTSIIFDEIKRLQYIE